MHPVTTIDLPLLPLEDPAFAADPFPHFATARPRRVSPQERERTLRDRRSALQQRPLW